MSAASKERMSDVRAWVIYDGGCGFCSRLARRIRRWDREGVVELVSLWDDDLETRFPEVTRDECLEAMVLVDRDRRLYFGADAFPPLLALLRGGALLRWPWLVPGGPALARRIYGWIARHRHALPGAACAAPERE